MPSETDVAPKAKSRWMGWGRKSLGRAMLRAPSIIFNLVKLWKISQGLVHTDGRLTGSQVRVRIVDAWTFPRQLTPLILPSWWWSWLLSSWSWWRGWRWVSRQRRWLCSVNERDYLRTVLSFHPPFESKAWKCLSSVSGLSSSFSWWLGHSLLQKAK